MEGAKGGAEVVWRKGREMWRGGVERERKCEGGDRGTVSEGSGGV